MKQTCTFLILMAVAGLACAQPPARQKTTGTVVNSQSGDQTGNGSNTSNGLSSSSQKTGSTVAGTAQSGNAAVNPQTNNAVPANKNSQGRKVCRTVGSTAYYCL